MISDDKEKKSKTRSHNMSYIFFKTNQQCDLLDCCIGCRLLWNLGTYLDHTHVIVICKSVHTNCNNVIYNKRKY